MKRTLTALALTLAPLGLAQAAEDGLLQTVSTGTVELKLNVTAPGPQIQVTGLEDLNFAFTLGQNPGKSLEQTVPLCIYMSAPGTYSFSLSGTPLSDGANEFDYSIIFSKLIGGFKFWYFESSRDTVQPGLMGEATGLTSSSTRDCGNTPSADLFISASYPDVETINTATNGPATATVTLTVAPD